MDELPATIAAASRLIDQASKTKRIYAQLRSLDSFVTLSRCATIIDYLSIFQFHFSHMCYYFFLLRRVFIDRNFLHGKYAVNIRRLRFHAIKLLTEIFNTLLNPIRKSNKKLECYMNYREKPSDLEKANFRVQNYVALSMKGRGTCQFFGRGNLDIYKIGMKLTKSLFDNKLLPIVDC